MKTTIQAFADAETIAIAGASSKKDNFGRHMMVEIQKSGKKVIPVNPGYSEVEGESCVKSALDLPPAAESLILAVPQGLTMEILEAAAKGPVKRVWFVRGAAKNDFLDEAIVYCMNQELEYVHDFCPMMFLGKARIHHFHLWLKKTIGKFPVEYTLDDGQMEISASSTEEKKAPAP